MGYQCQICSKEFNRKDIINYHAYNEHREELLEYGKGLPEVLTRDPADSSPPSKGTSNNAASAVFGRIFKPKMMSGNKGSVRKGQVEVQVKSKNDDDDEDDRRMLKTKLVEEELTSKSRKDQPESVKVKSKSGKNDDDHDRRKFKTMLFEDEKVNKSKKDPAEVR